MKPSGLMQSTMRHFVLLMIGLFTLSACGGSSNSGSGTTTPATYAISGTVTGAAGVTMTLSGAATATTTTGAGGAYSLTALANGSYTVTPSLTGYTFSPASAAVSVSGANVTGTNFTATAVTPATYSITGMVTTATGAAASGVTLTLTGSAGGSQTSDASGAYTFSSLAAGTYTVTPTLAGYTFAPASAQVTITTANQTATTFVATAVVQATYTLTGSVSGAVGSGVTVNLTGATTASTTTAANGTYSFSGLADGSYTVTPSLTGYSFAPVSSSVTINGANPAATNFVSTANVAPTYSLTGTVTGVWVRNVTVTLSGAGTGTTVTDASGNFSFSNLPAGSYTVTPSLAGYTYSPAAPVVALNANTTQNFTAASAFTSYSISGSIAYAGSKTGPVMVWVYNCTTCGGQTPNASTTVALTGSAGAYTGSYTIRGLQPGNYTVVAQIDTLASGQANATNPGGGTSGLNITNANLTGVNLTLTDPAPVQPVAPTVFTVSPENSSAMIQYTPAVNSTNEELATTYKIYWGTDTAASNGGSKTFTAQGTNTDIYILQGLANGATYFKMTALVGTTESAPTAVIGPVTVGATSGANILSGTVTFPGTATGPLVVGAYNSASNALYFTAITNPVSPQSYSVAGVPNGNYKNFAVIDMNNNSVVDAGDLTNTNGNTPAITVNGNTSGNLTLSAAATAANVFTDHWSDGTTSNFSFNLSVANAAKRAVAVTLYSGPNVAVPFDLGPGGSGNQVYMQLGNPTQRPTVGDTYVFQVTYSDGTQADVTAAVTGVLDAFATNLMVNTGAPYSRSVPQFMWSAPASPPASYVYFMNVNGADANWQYPQNNGLSSSTLSAIYDVDGSATKSTLTTGVAYNWQVTVQDKATKNTATYQAPPYTP